jgi:hypothetical protein
VTYVTLCCHHLTRNMTGHGPVSLDSELSMVIIIESIAAQLTQPLFVYSLRKKSNCYAYLYLVFQCFHQSNINLINGFGA